MKIKEIHIQNYRGIEELHIENVDPNINLIIGINGSGKTSILDSISIALSWIIARMKSVSSKGVVPKENDVRLGTKDQLKISITLENGVQWSICKSKAYSIRKKQTSCKTDLAEISSFTEQIIKNVETGGSIPVLMYYPVERAIASAPVNLHKSEPVIWDVYQDALSGNSNFRSLFEWYRRQEDVENEMIRDNISYRDRSLSAIRTAISIFFPEFSELRVRRRPNQAMVVKKEDKIIEFTQLSQGEKCYLSLVCDIARRLAVANPHMEDPLSGEGIILIDEVDLHLHPKWQSEIISKLNKVFPNCQFFLSSHSAIVLSDTQKKQIIPISNGQILDIAYDPFGKLASEIMNNYFDMPYQRNLSIACDIENAFKALRSNDTQQFEELYNKLKNIIGTSDPDVVNLTIEAKRRGIK